MLFWTVLDIKVAIWVVLSLGQLTITAVKRAVYEATCLSRKILRLPLQLHDQHVLHAYTSPPSTVSPFRAHACCALR
jgi:hypothetical protein